MAWFASGILAFLLAGRLGRPGAALLFGLAALVFAPFVYPLPRLAAGLAAAAVLHVPLLWAARRTRQAERLPLPLLAAGAALCLFGLLGPEEGLF